MYPPARIKLDSSLQIGALWVFGISLIVLITTPLNGNSPYPSASLYTIGSSLLVAAGVLLHGIRRSGIVVVRPKDFLNKDLNLWLLGIDPEENCWIGGRFNLFHHSIIAVYAPAIREDDLKELTSLFIDNISNQKSTVVKLHAIKALSGEYLFTLKGNSLNFNQAEKEKTTTDISGENASS